MDSALLNHYGFVPSSRDIDEDDQYSEADHDNDETVAEVFIAGNRFEVSTFVRLITAT